MSARDSRRWAFRSARKPSLCAALLLEGAVLSTPSAVFAQSAADKATARDLAVAGIQAYNAEDYQEACDKLARAQALYDAHVHLAYLGRCNEKLGRLVEAAEAYRALARKPLPGDASDAVKRAQSDGIQELARLEGRIPSLLVEVAPEGVRDLTWTINGQAVPAAALGVHRPVNPGENAIVVSAPGYKTAEAAVNLAEGEKKAVKLSLQEAEGAPQAGPGGEPGEVDREGGGGEDPGRDRFERSFLLMLAARGGFLLPFGRVNEMASYAPDGSEVTDTMALRDLITVGGGAELQLGLRLAKHYTPKVFVGGYLMKPENGFDRLGFRSYGPTSNPDVASARSTSRLLHAGVGFAYSTAPLKLGYFAELDLMINSVLGNVDVTVTERARAAGAGDCTAEVSLPGAGLRAGGGATVPIVRVLNLNPFVDVAFLRGATGKLRGSCGESQDVPGGKWYGFLQAGIGGEFLL